MFQKETKRNINVLALKIEDLDAAGGSSAQPVSVRAEHQGIDDVTGLEGVQVLAVVQVPEHGDTILATGGGERTIGGDGDGVDIPGMSVVVGAQLALGKLPDLLRKKIKSAPNRIEKTAVVGKKKAIRDLGDKVLSHWAEPSEVANIMCSIILGRGEGKQQISDR